MDYQRGLPSTGTGARLVPLIQIHSFEVLLTSPFWKVRLLSQKRGCPDHGDSPMCNILTLLNCFTTQSHFNQLFYTISNIYVCVCVWASLYVYVCVAACSHPGDYGEEREGDRSPGCICTLVEWQLIGRGPRPLIGQEAETYKVQEGPETCQKTSRTIRLCYRRKNKVISKIALDMKHKVQMWCSQLPTHSALFPLEVKKTQSLLPFYTTLQVSLLLLCCGATKQ